jgi:hypothetical protein
VIPPDSDFLPQWIKRFNDSMVLDKRSPRLISSTTRKKRLVCCLSASAQSCLKRPSRRSMVAMGLRRLCRRSLALLESLVYDQGFAR